MNMRKNTTIKTINIMECINEDDLNLPLNSNETYFYFGKYIIIERLILFFILSSLFLEEFQFSNQKLKEEISIKMSYIIFTNSIILLILMINKYIVYRKYSIAKKFWSNNKYFFNYEYNILFIFELIVLLCHGFFFLNDKNFKFKNKIDSDIDIDYNLNDIFHFISLTKIIIGFKIILLNSSWANDKSYRICKMYGCKNNIVFIVRCLMKEKPILFVLYFLLMGIIYFGGVIRIFEYPIDIDNKELSFSYLINSYWCIIITMTTVGFGDMYPATNLGRIVIIFCGIFGITVISLMVVSVTNTFEMSITENKSYIILKRLKYREKMKKYGSSLITLFLKYKIIIKRNRFKPSLKNKLKLEYLEEKFKINIRIFKRNRRYYKSINDNNVIEEIDRMNGNLNDKIKKIKTLIKNNNNKFKTQH